VGNALVEDAQTGMSVAPNRLSTLALGNLLGILLAIGTALVLDALNTSKTVKGREGSIWVYLARHYSCLCKSENSL